MLLNQITNEISELQHDNAVLKKTNIIFNHSVKERDAEINRLAHVSAKVQALNERVVYERDEAIAVWSLAVKERNDLRVENGRLQREWDVAHAANDQLVKQHIEHMGKIEDLTTDKKELLDSIDSWREYANRQCRDIETLKLRVQQLENCTCKFQEPGATGPWYQPHDWDKNLGGLGSIGGK